MDYRPEKVYVAVGNSQQNGFKTLEWALQKWNSHYISIIILYINHSNFQDFVSTPFGKLPASSVSDEKLEVLRKYDEEKIDKLLSTYIAFCGKVKAGILKVENFNEPPHKLIVNLISRLRITKLVIEFTFMKSPSWRSKNAISGSFYVHEHKPEFCQLFIVCDGKLIFLRGESDEGFMEDDGVMVAKVREKGSFKGWIGKMFAENLTDSIARNSSAPSTKLDSTGSQTQWGNNLHDIEIYYQQLCSSNLNEEEDEVLQTTPPEHNNSIMSDAAKIEYTRSKIDEAQKTLELKKIEGKANVERLEKAEWAILLCNQRTKELDTQTNEEISNQMHIKNELQSTKEYFSEILHDIEETKIRLNSLLEFQPELSNKLKASSLKKSNAEAEIQIAVNSRLQTIRETNELQQQRDVLRMRIDYCKQTAETLMESSLSDPTCSYKEYTAGEIRSATNNFSERLRLKSGGNWTNVYRGRFNNATYAIKMLDRAAISQESFESKVKILTDIRHPHFVAMIGSCSELKCIVFEYMHNGSLRDILSSSNRNSRTLQWHDRIRIIYEICMGLGFLHSSKPRPISHGNLNPSNILLDRNLVGKINGDLGNQIFSDGYDIGLDIRALGVLMLNLLTGMNWAGLVEDTIVMGRAGLVKVLDQMAGPWPMNLAEEFAGLAIRCVSHCSVTSTDYDYDYDAMMIGKIMEELDGIQKKSDNLMAGGGCDIKDDGGGDDKEDSIDLPSVLLCPIYKEVMKNPYVAEDGFSYELEAIQEWLRTGHNTSPMTNLELKHNFLTPNHTLFSLIQDWHSKKYLGFGK